jgi:hypothetical protein
MAQARSVRRRDRGRDTSGVRGGGLRSQPHSRNQRTGGAPALAGGREAALMAVALRVHRRRCRVLVNCHDDFRYTSCDRRGLEDRVRQAHRRAGANGARRWSGRGTGAGRPRRIAGTVAGLWRPGKLEQNRAQWDWLLICRGLSALERAGRLGHARALRSTGCDCRLPRAGSRAGRDRLGAHRRSVRCSGPTLALSRRGTEPGRRALDGFRTTSGPGDR